MCELFAINSRSSVLANDALRRFYEDSVWHPHGWGLSWREGGRTILHKEPVRAIDSDYLRGLLHEPLVVSRLVAHIRNATMGVLSYENSHPFELKDVTGHTWVIAHNGTMLDAHLVLSCRDRAEGDTDSEQVALYLVDQIDEATRRKGGALTFDERFTVLTQAMVDLSPSNKLNLLIDDGECTYVHTNTVEPTLYVRTMNDTVLLCTAPQDDSGQWEVLPQNRLIAYRDGKVLRMGPRHDFSMDEEGYLRAIAGLRPA